MRFDIEEFRKYLIFRNPCL